jgi:two-component system phosphate regulon sensor histidine kinase PhoR
VRRRRLLWQLYPSYLAVTLLALVAVAWFASSTARRFYIEETARDLESRAHLVRKQVEGKMVAESASVLDALCKELGRESGTRITLIRPLGQVVADSEENPDQMEPHTGRARAEIRGALEGGSGHSIRYSHTLQRSMLYVAIPIRAGGGDRGETIGVVRTAIPLTSVENALRAIYLKIILGAIVAAVLCAAVSLAIARRISRPLEELRSGAESFSRGELERTLPIADIEEIGSLAESMNRMAGDLDERIRTITRQRNEQEAILLSMVEGVVALDPEERVVSMNDAGARILQLDPGQVRGSRFWETFRNPDLQQLVSRALQEGHPVEGTVRVHKGGEQILQVHGAPIRDAQGLQMGVVLVLNDITRLQRLEGVRREFVANVSHELKTPITSIKAAAETLADGAWGDVQHAQRFLQMVVRQADRLSSIVEDLLSLSRIESQTEVGAVALAHDRILPVLAAAVQTCEPRASQKEIGIALSCPDELGAKINPPLLETAVVNLVDNAIKYGDARSGIEITAKVEGEEILIAVRDEGCGIAPEHVDRIFERFYRVDKGRSRNLGGTGLGLSIVKHIARAHGGSVDVESEVGKGSTFRIHLPGAGKHA